MPNVDVLIMPALPWQQSFFTGVTDLHSESGEDTGFFFFFCIGRIFTGQ